MLAATRKGIRGLERALIEPSVDDISRAPNEPMIEKFFCEIGADILTPYRAHIWVVPKQFGIARLNDELPMVDAPPRAENAGGEQNIADAETSAEGNQLSINSLIMSCRGVSRSKTRTNFLLRQDIELLIFVVQSVISTDIANPAHSRVVSLCVANL